jgi:hypothetical protein
LAAGGTIRANPVPPIKFELARRLAFGFGFPFCADLLKSVAM